MHPWKSHLRLSLIVAICATSVAALVGPGVRHQHHGGNEHHHHGHAHHHDHHSSHNVGQAHIHVQLLGMDFTLPDWVSNGSQSIGQRAEIVDVLGPISFGQLLSILFALVGLAAVFVLLHPSISGQLAPFLIGSGLCRSAPPSPPPRHRTPPLAFHRFR